MISSPFQFSFLCRVWENWRRARPPSPIVPPVGLLLLLLLRWERSLLSPSRVSPLHELFTVACLLCPAVPSVCPAADEAGHSSSSFSFTGCEARRALFRSLPCAVIARECRRRRAPFPTVTSLRDLLLLRAEQVEILLSWFFSVPCRDPREPLHPLFGAKPLHLPCWSRARAAAGCVRWCVAAETFLPPSPLPSQAAASSVLVSARAELCICGLLVVCCGN